VESIKVIFTPTKGQPQDTTITGKDIDNMPNFIDKVSEKLGNMPEIDTIKVVITTITKP